MISFKMLVISRNISTASSLMFIYLFMISSSAASLCTTLLVHGNPAPTLPSMQGTYVLQQGLILNLPWWKQVDGPGHIQAYQYSPGQWVVRGQSFYYARCTPTSADELYPYQLTCIWEVKTASSGYSFLDTPEFKIECEETGGDFWRLDGVCEGEQSTFSTVAAAPATPGPRLPGRPSPRRRLLTVGGEEQTYVTQAACLLRCKADPVCVSFSISRYGCFPSSTLCSKRKSISATGFTYTNTLSSTLQLNKTVYQSSIDITWDGRPEHATDGDLTPSMVGGLALTLEEAHPWWAVDLGAPYLIQAVVITNRGDCCSDRLLNTIISVGRDTDVNQVIPGLSAGELGGVTLCAVVTTLGSRLREVYTCNVPVAGQVVVLHKATLPGQQDLIQLSEVEVWWKPVPRFHYLSLIPPGGIRAGEMEGLCNATFLSGEPLELSDVEKEQVALEEVDGGSGVWVSQAPSHRPPRYTVNTLTGRLFNAVKQSSLAATCTSSATNADSVCGNAYDDSTVTGWFPIPPPEGTTLQINFALTYLVHNVQIQQPYNKDGSIENVTLHFSDGSTLNVTLKQRQGMDAADSAFGSDWDDVIINPPRHSSYVKVEVVSVYGTNNNGILELHVYGEIEPGLEPHDGGCTGPPVVTSTSGSLSACQRACFNHHNCSSFTWYFQGIKEEDCDLMSEPCTTFTENADAVTLNIIADSPTSGFYVTDDECEDRYNYVAYINDVTVTECAARCRAYTACFRFVYCTKTTSGCGTQGRCLPIYERCAQKSVNKRDPAAVVFILKEPASQRVPSYLGCSSEVPPSSLYATTENIGLYAMTPDGCREYCRLKEFKYALVSGSVCSCSNVINAPDLHNAPGFRDGRDDCYRRCYDEFTDLNCGYYQRHGIYTTAPEPVRDCVFLTTQDQQPVTKWRLVKTVCDHVLSKAICERPYDYCSDSPCQNEGQCEGGANGFSCTCLPGYTGTLCQTDIDDCSGQPCGYHGYCEDGVHSSTCDCSPGYTGNLCQTEIDECKLADCYNNATCRDLVANYQCACQEGYTGSHCETDMSECVSEPCQNGGRCVDGPSRFSCVCTPAYHGVICEAEVDECASSPCQHNATCLDLIGRYECQCPGGYIGDHCQIERDECSGAPCRNNATCEDLLNDFQCVCPPGVTGPLCEIDVDECAVSPCENYGTCHDLVNGYRCDCLAGFGCDSCECYLGNPGNWSQWSAWDACSVTCGWGSRSRSRECLPQFPELGEGHCATGVSTEEERCELRSCPPVDGGWGSWYPSSACSTSCGPGLWRVERRCDTPAPQNGGKPCPDGPSDGRRVCHLRPCADGAAPTEACSSWSPWSDCSSTCGWGHRTRTRQCQMSSATNNTTQDTDQEMCYLKDCHQAGRMCDECEATYTPTSLTLAGCQGETTCPADKPFCSTVVSKQGKDVFHLKKGCSSEETCETRLTQSQSYPCVDMFLTQYAVTIGDDVIRTWRNITTSCTICCRGDLCNQELLPRRITAYGYTGQARKPLTSVYAVILSLMSIFVLI